MIYLIVVCLYHDFYITLALYDQGYTSLGSTIDTIKNPNLLLDNGCYLPASKLIDENLERAGRIARKN